MPTRPKHGCLAPGCPNLVESGRSYCPEHRKRQARKRDEKRPTATERGYDHTWRKLRKMVLAREPLCRDPFGVHARMKQSVAAQEVDHIIPLRAGGANTEGNLMPLCRDCHQRKSRVENRRRIRPARIPTSIIVGPPASGKTTFVNEEKRHGDLVVDVDWLFRALSGGLDWYDKPVGLLPFVMEARDAAIARLGLESDVRHAWIITSETDLEKLHELKHGLDAQLLLKKTSSSECVKRVHNDDRRSDKADLWTELIEDWFDKWTGPPF